MLPLQLVAGIISSFVVFGHLTIHTFGALGLHKRSLSRVKLWKADIAVLSVSIGWKGWKEKGQIGVGVATGSDFAFLGFCLWGLFPCTHC